jgi:hypothetical protein
MKTFFTGFSSSGAGKHGKGHGIILKIISAKIYKSCKISDIEV